MATMNPFDLLGDDDTEDLTKLIAKPLPAQAVPAKPVQPAPKPSAKQPSKAQPPAQDGRESKFDASRGVSRGGSRVGARGRGGAGGRGFNRDSADGDNTFVRSNGYSGGFGAPEGGEAGKNPERRVYDGPRGGSRGSRRGGFGNGEVAEGERPRRGFERRSGTGRGNEFKREGAGRGNWGTPTDEITPETEQPVTEGEKVVDTEKQPGQEDAADANKDTTPAAEPEEKPEDKEMTLEEYEKVLEEKRKALLAMKPEERKVVSDKEFKSMQLLSSKKNEEEIFAKLGVDKEKKKDFTEKAKKSVSINEFLKPAEGENNYRSGGRGRGRGRGGRGGDNNYRSGNTNNVPAPSIEDVGQFPTLGGK